jgi:hypothetical protein
MRTTPAAMEVIPHLSRAGAACGRLPTSWGFKSPLGHQIAPVFLQCQDPGALSYRAPNRLVVPPRYAV